jgi:hypothetical protein
MSKTSGKLTHGVLGKPTSGHEESLIATSAFQARTQTKHLPHRCDDNRKQLFLNLLIFYLIFIFFVPSRGDLLRPCHSSSRDPKLFLLPISSADSCSALLSYIWNYVQGLCSAGSGRHTHTNTGFVMHCHYWWLQCGNLRIAGRSLLVSRFHCWFYRSKLLYLAVLHLFVWERSSEKVVCHGFSDYRWAWVHWVHWTIRLWCWGKLTGRNATGLMLEPKTWTRKLVCKRKMMQVTEHLYTAQNRLEMAIVKSLT